MPNMSYCRWQNTASDLRDCLNVLEEGIPGNGPNDRAERQARDRILRMAIEMVEAFGGEIEWAGGGGPTLPTTDDADGDCGEDA